MSLPLADLSSVIAWIERAASTLDPDSRYVQELLATVRSSTSIGDLEARIRDARGQRHAGADVYARMSLEQKLLANLITPETSLFRFSEGEMEAIDRDLLPGLRAKHTRVLIVPCSHGEEAYTMAAYLLKVGVDFEIDAFDIQPALIEEARTGRLTFGYPLEHLRSPGYVGEEVLRRIRFEVGDAFDLPPAPAPYDVILCRNFAGYFRPEAAKRLIESLASRVAPRGALMLDGFCLSKMPELALIPAGHGARRLGPRPVFCWTR